MTNTEKRTGKESSEIVEMIVTKLTRKKTKAGNIDNDLMLRLCLENNMNMDHIISVVGNQF